METRHLNTRYIPLTSSYYKILYTNLSSKHTLQSIPPPPSPKPPFVAKTYTITMIYKKTGEICLDLLKTAWSPAFGIVTTLTEIHRLLSYPVVDSPLNVDVAILLREGDNIGAEGLVRWCCREWRWGGGDR